jgi:hypothetical protein
MRKSATAAAPTTTVACARCCITAARISSALVTGTNAQPCGGSSAVGALTRITCAPRRSAASAIA